MLKEIKTRWNFFYLDFKYGFKIESILNGSPVQIVGKCTSLVVQTSIPVFFISLVSLFSDDSWNKFFYASISEFYQVKFARIALLMFIALLGLTLIFRRFKFVFTPLNYCLNYISSLCVICFSVFSGVLVGVVFPTVITERDVHYLYVSIFCVFIFSFLSFVIFTLNKRAGDSAVDINRDNDKFYYLGGFSSLFISVILFLDPVFFPRV